MEMFGKLCECTIILITLLVKCYEGGYISYEVFEKNVKLKIKFLTENIDSIQMQEEKATVEKLLEKCADIFMSSHSCF